jgi:hypothetical protein
MNCVVIEAAKGMRAVPAALIRACQQTAVGTLDAGIKHLNTTVRHRSNQALAS